MTPWPPITDPGLIDEGLMPWLEELNDIPTVETLQSCSGDHPKAEGPALVWLAGRLRDITCRKIAEHSGIETVSILYNREPFAVTEIMFFDSLPSETGDWLVRILEQDADAFAES